MKKSKVWGRNLAFKQPLTMGEEHEEEDDREADREGNDHASGQCLRSGVCRRVAADGEVRDEVGHTIDSLAVEDTEQLLARECVHGVCEHEQQ